MALRDPKTIEQARTYAADYERRLIESIQSGETRCNDPEGWIKQLETSVEETEAGKHDANFTIWQRMHYFLTGECVPLLA